MHSDTQKLLAWYDQNSRSLPWRVPPSEVKRGVFPDVYKVWLSEVMLQQTTVAAVKEYFLSFTQRWPTVFDLAQAPDEDILAAWAGLGYYARARNLIKCARVVAYEMKGVFPNTQERLLELPGVGPYTAAAIASIAFGQRAVVVDGNVERVMSRKHAVMEDIKKARSEIVRISEIYTPESRPGCYAQALMDLGATVCTPKNPKCEICPWQTVCVAFSRGEADQFPKKAPKKAKPVWVADAFVLRGEKGEWGLERRPEKGLLGGMEGFPTTVWGESRAEFEPPLMGDWIQVGEIKHTFTHLHLRLKVWCLRAPVKGWPNKLRRVSASDFSVDDLPTAMRKVAASVQKFENEAGLISGNPSCR